MVLLNILLKGYLKQHQVKGIMYYEQSLLYTVILEVHLEHFGIWK